jgi:hypothetical protein
MQNRRVGEFGVEQFGQILGGRISPSGSFVPHFMQNLRVALFPVPQLVQMRSASGTGGVGGVDGVDPGTTPPASSSDAVTSVIAGVPSPGTAAVASPAGSPVAAGVLAAVSAARSSRIEARSAAR